MPDQASKLSQRFLELLDTSSGKEILDTLNELMTIPGAYEVFSEYYNNRVLEEWEKEQLN